MKLIMTGKLYHCNISATTLAELYTVREENDNQVRVRNELHESF